MNKLFLTLVIFALFLFNPVLGATDNRLTCRSTDGGAWSVYAYTSLGGMVDNVVTYNLTTNTAAAGGGRVCIAEVWAHFYDENETLQEERLSTYNSCDGALTTTQYSVDMDTEFTNDFQELIGIYVYCYLYDGATSYEAKSTADLSYIENDGTFSVAYIDDEDYLYVAGTTIPENTNTTTHYIMNMPHEQVNYGIDWFVYDDSVFSSAQVATPLYTLRIINDADAANLSNLQGVINSTDYNVVNINSTVPDTLDVYDTLYGDPLTTRINVTNDVLYLLTDLDTGDFLGATTHANSMIYDTDITATTHYMVNAIDVIDGYDSEDLALSYGGVNGTITRAKQSANPDYNNVFVLLENAVQWSEPYEYLFRNLLGWGESEGGTYAYLVNVANNEPREGIGYVEISVQYYDENGDEITDGTCTVLKDWQEENPVMTYENGAYRLSETNTLTNNDYYYQIRCEKSGYWTRHSEKQTLHVSFVDPETVSFIEHGFLRNRGATGDENVDINDGNVYYYVHYENYYGVDITGADCTAQFNGTEYVMLYTPQIREFEETIWGYVFQFGNGVLASDYYLINATCSHPDYDSATTSTLYYTLLATAPIEMNTQTDKYRFRTDETMPIHTWYYQDDEDSGNPRVTMGDGNCNITVGGETWNMTWNSSKSSFTLLANSSVIGEGTYIYLSECDGGASYDYDSRYGVIRISDKEAASLNGMNLFLDVTTRTANNLDFCAVYAYYNETSNKYIGISDATCEVSYSTYAPFDLDETLLVELELDNYRSHRTSEFYLEEAVENRAYCGRLINMNLNQGDAMYIQISCESNDYESDLNTYQLYYSDSPTLLVSLTSPYENQEITNNYISIYGTVTGCEDQCSTGVCRVTIGYDGYRRYYDSRYSGSYYSTFYNVNPGNHTALFGAECDVSDEYSGYVYDRVPFNVTYGTPSSSFLLTSNPNPAVKGFDIPVNIYAGESGSCKITRTDLRATIIEGEPVMTLKRLYKDSYNASEAVRYVSVATFDDWLRTKQNTGNPIVAQTVTTLKAALTGTVSSLSGDVFDVSVLLPPGSDTNPPLTNEIIFDLDNDKLYEWVMEQSDVQLSMLGFNVTGTTNELLSLYQDKDWHDNFDKYPWGRIVEVSQVEEGRNQLKVNRHLVFDDATDKIQSGKIDVVEPLYSITAIANERNLNLDDLRIKNRLIKLNATLNIYCEESDSGDYYTQTIYATTLIGADTLTNTIVRNIPWQIFTVSFLIFFIIILTPLIMSYAKMKSGKGG